MYLEQVAGNKIIDFEENISQTVGIVARFVTVCISASPLILFGYLNGIHIMWPKIFQLAMLQNTIEFDN